VTLGRLPLSTGSDPHHAMRTVRLAALLSPVLVAGVVACRASDSLGAPEPAPFAASIEDAHGDGSLYAKPPLHGDLVVEFGGNRLVDGTMVFDAATGRARIESGDSVLVFDGEQAWGVGAEALGMPARFHLLTWPYFVAAPWKLGDPGSEMGAPALRPLAGTRLASARLTFDDGVGDTPDDWYVVYQDPATGGLRALAYIVTYGTTAAEASEEPHVATYDETAEVDGLRVPTRLAFWNWSEAEGLVGDPIGRVTFTSPRFGPAEPGAFEKPEGAVLDALPE
jgi:hypothetical protein